MPVNQVKKLFDLEKTRRVKCRHFNGTIPMGCPRIFCTNSDLEAFYPKMKSKQDRTGVSRRQLFQVVPFDVRLQAAASGPQLLPAPALQLPVQDDAETWQTQLQRACEDAKVSHYAKPACHAAQHLGVAVWDEVVEVADQIAQMTGMKLLERRRFLGQIR